MLPAHRGIADAAGIEWKSAVYRKVKEEVNAARGLSLERMVQLGRVSRASFYRFDENAPPSQDAAMNLRDAIQRLALEWPSYGRPRITAELRRCGWKVNPKRVYRIMREDNLLCIRKRKFVEVFEGFPHGGLRLRHNEGRKGASRDGDCASN